MAALPIGTSVISWSLMSKLNKRLDILNAGIGSDLVSEPNAVREPPLTEDGVTLSTGSLASSHLRIECLERLSGLWSFGALTDEEFAAEKSKLTAAGT
jgi:hypothetical protein